MTDISLLSLDYPPIYYIWDQIEKTETKRENLKQNVSDSSVNKIQNIK